MQITVQYWYDGDAKTKLSLLIAILSAQFPFSVGFIQLIYNIWSWKCAMPNGAKPKRIASNSTALNNVSVRAK